MKERRIVLVKINHLSSIGVSDQLTSELLEQPRGPAEEIMRQRADVDHNASWPRGFPGHAHNSTATSLTGS